MSLTIFKEQIALQLSDDQLSLGSLDFSSAATVDCTLSYDQLSNGDAWTQFITGTTYFDESTKYSIRLQFNFENSLQVPRFNNNVCLRQDFFFFQYISGTSTPVSGAAVADAGGSLIRYDPICQGDATAESTYLVHVNLGPFSFRAYFDTFQRWFCGPDRSSRNDWFVCGN